MHSDGKKAPELCTAFCVYYYINRMMLGDINATQEALLGLVTRRRFFVVLMDFIGICVRKNKFSKIRTKQKNFVRIPVVLSIIEARNSHARPSKYRRV